jgi:methylmalonyl-CoA/ethylmalonyl-CoA epimerase
MNGHIDTTSLDNTIARLELAQICWVVPDIYAAVRFLSSSLGVAGFPQPELVRAQELGMTQFNQLVDGEWLTTQTYNGGVFVELVQPVSGQSMFHDYLAQHPAGGIQHIAFRLPVSELDQVITDMCEHGYKIISKVDHPIARMAFFDTYQTLGVATEIMGITPEGWIAIEQMRNTR